MTQQHTRTDVAIVIPVYNEATVVGDVIRNLLQHFTTVVCVNDGSSDDSAKVIEQAGGLLVDHPINMGQGAALQTGLDFARLLPVDYFCTFDADGQHRIQDVQAMLVEIENGPYDIILGSRFLGTEAIDMPKSKRRVLKLAVWFSNLTSGLKLTDTHNGLRVLNRPAADGIQITMADMTHASEILELIKANELRYKEIPVTIEYTEYSRAKGQSLMNAINIAFDTLLRKILR